MKKDLCILYGQVFVMGQTKSVDRPSLLSYRLKPTADKAVLQFVMTYNPGLAKVRNSVDNTLSSSNIQTI